MTASTPCLTENGKLREQAVQPVEKSSCAQIRHPLGGDENGGQHHLEKPILAQLVEDCILHRGHKRAWLTASAPISKRLSWSAHLLHNNDGLSIRLKLKLSDESCVSRYLLPCMNMSKVRVHEHDRYLHSLRAGAQVGGWPSTPSRAQSSQGNSVLSLSRRQPATAPRLLAQIPSADLGTRSRATASMTASLTSLCITRCQPAHSALSSSQITIAGDRDARADRVDAITGDWPLSL